MSDEYWIQLYRLGYLSRIIDYLRENGALRESDKRQMEIGREYAEKDIQHGQGFRDWDIAPNIVPSLTDALRPTRMAIVRKVE